MKTIPTLIILTILLMYCTTEKQKADLIVTNAKVYTVNENFEVAESFAVKEGKFMAVGSNGDINENYSAKLVVDAKGKAIYPGFFDAHCHFYYYGLGLQQIDLVGTKSFDEVVERVANHAKNYTSEWIQGHGWDQNDWETKEFPTKEKLDKLFPDKPIVLTRIDGHAMLANSAALDRAGVRPNSKVEGGKFVTENGKLTGVLIDNAMEMVTKAIPQPDRETQIKALLDAQKKCFAVGLTTIDDAGLDKGLVLLVDELQKQGELKMRVYAMLSPSEANINHFVKKGGYKTDYLNVRSIKLFADGALGSRGACLIEPYSDHPENNGLLLNTEDKLGELCKIAYENNFQINTHAIGDSANRLMLNIYGEFLKSGNDRRWRIEHAQVVNENDFSLFEKYSIVPSVQPTHATSDMYWAHERLGNARVKNAYAYKTLMQQNGWLAAGSDFPIENINPLYGFYAAVARMDFEQFPKDGFQTENALTRKQALKAMTLWAAKANFEENEKGSIEVGKFADFVILDKDVMTVDVKEIPTVKVMTTYIGGVCVY